MFLMTRVLAVLLQLQDIRQGILVAICSTWNVTVIVTDVRHKRAVP